MELQGKSKYYMFIDRMQYNIIEAVENCFDKETDPEVNWSVFRDYLRKLKKQNAIEYSDYLESDAEDEDSESEYAKYRRENPHHFK